ncbi:MAG: amidohydrolase family protein [Actinomycetota bacterium]
MASYDLVIRNGTVIDGSGADRIVGDVAVTEGTIAAVGDIDGTGRREIDADGHLVFPGFVDIHTHYDGQATWDRELAPSSWHGVTTVVAGNCGVGFAPVHTHNRERLIQLMEGVEDIPGAALHEGLPWEWETFGEYLDYLEHLPRDIDFGTQLPHGALRLHVMGERGATQEPATAEDIQAMAALARQAILDGALGFSTSRTLNHRTSLGEYTPTLKAEADELVGISKAVGSTGRGVLQVVSDFFDLEGEFDLVHAMAAESGRPISISIVQNNQDPNQWRDLLDRCAAATAEGVTMRGQVGARAIGLLFGHQGTLSPFMHSPLYQELAGLPHEERMATMARPEVKQQILDETRADRTSAVLGAGTVNRFRFMFELGEEPDYEPDMATSVEARANAAGIEPAELAYDLLAADGGTAMLYMPILNYRGGNLDAIREQLLHPAAVPGLSDGGAHVGTICDVSFPSTLMQWWGRDRPTGRIPLETIVHKQARATAETVGLLDRGVLAPGYRADINVLDLDAMNLRAPEMHFDLPAGGKRLLQRVDGYRHTFVRGEEILADGESTGATPGGVLRGPTTI